FQATLYGYKTVTGSATVKITKRQVTITAASDEKIYGNADPKFKNAAMTGQVEGELGNIDLTVIRSDAGTDAGEKLGKHEGVLIIKDSKSDLEGAYTNYTFEIKPANFTIKTNETALTVSAANVEKVYDGNAYGVTATASLKGATIKYKDADGNYTLAKSPTRTNVGTTTVEFQATLYGYKTVTGSATVKVTKRPLTIKAASDEKVYDEKPLINKNYEVVKATDTIGLVGEDAIKSVKVEGSQLLVGTSDNVASEAVFETGNSNNYEISYVNGVLKVTDGTETEPVEPGKVVTKNHKGEKYGLGETVKFEIVVTNIYDETKTITINEQVGVKITGEKVFNNVKPGTPVNTTAEYKITEADILRGSFTNTVTASFSGGKDFENSDKVDIEPVRATYTIDKTADDEQKTEYKVGETIKYTITVENKGNVTIKNVKVTDQLINASSKVSFTNLNGATLNDDNTVTIESLAPEAVVTLNCEYKVTREDAGKRIANTVIANTNQEIDNPVTPDEVITPKDPDGEDPSDSTDPVSVEKLYNLTIHYVYANGETAAKDYRGQYLEGEAYGPIYSPTINGYTPDYAFIVSDKNGMLPQDVEVTVVYTANPVVAPVTPPDGGDGDNPADGNNPAAPAAATAAAAPVGATIQANADGGVNLVPVEDDKVPLAKRDLENHYCCILHFLLMLLALIALIWYTADMKRRQARIAELKDELETEQIRRGGLSR
ncbi:MAG: MBG domain-containing protein, partial [Bacillota bacterium]|nr:MBG domain-containing protein [Bacillota bacterium]